MSAQPNSGTPDRFAQQRRKKLLFGLAGVVALTSIAIFTYWSLIGSRYVSTDNAYAAAEVAQITPSVGGTVKEVRVNDTQTVKKDDILLLIDPRDAEIAVVSAQAELDRAIRRVKSYTAQDSGLSAQVKAKEAEEKRAQAQLNAAEADFERAKVDLQRRQALSQSGSVSGDELTRAKNSFAAAQANLTAAKAMVAQTKANREATIGAMEANKALIADVNEDQNPEVAVAQARLAQAKLDLERTTIRAPIDGVVAKRNVQLGQRIQAGMPVMAIVPVLNMYVDANFKEVQLKKVRIGQSVELHADIYGNAVTYHGIVEGFSGGSGSAFSAIPAQNATGNWIKVVQRLPVRIKLNAEELKDHPLKVGLSMNAQIDTRSPSN